jgi:transcriptional antiterminator RfaH
MTAVSGSMLPVVDAPRLGRDEDGRDSRRWYAVHTLPHREFRAETQLANQGFRVFLPRRLKTVRHARKLSSVPAPFFPRYLFVELDLACQRWRSVNGTFGVASLVMQGDLPLAVPRGVVETMLVASDGNGRLCLQPYLQVGSQVRLAAGPFAEQLATLDRLDDSGRVVVLLELMGAAVPVRIGRELILPAA